MSNKNIWVSEIAKYVTMYYYEYHKKDILHYHKMINITIYYNAHDMEGAYDCLFVCYVGLWNICFWVPVTTEGSMHPITKESISKLYVTSPDFSILWILRMFFF